MELKSKNQARRFTFRASLLIAPLMELKFINLASTSFLMLSFNRTAYGIEIRIFSIFYQHTLNF